MEETRGTGDDWRGKVGQMDQGELEAFFGRGVVARLATLDERGWPYVVPVWFEYDAADGGFWVIGRRRSVWCDHIRRDGRVGLTIDENESPYRKVIVQGTAEIVEEANVGGAWVPIAERMSLRYLGPHGPDYLVPTLNQPRILIKIRPDRVKTWQGVEWHQRYKEA